MRLFEERAAVMNAAPSGGKREQARTTEDQTDEEPLLPEHMCENEAERLEWRADVLELLRDHLEPLGDVSPQ